MGATYNVTANGINFPNLTAAQRTAIATPASGLTVYQNDASKGLYFYDGSSWIGLMGLDTNIYNTNGSLTGNRTVTQGANTLAFTSTAVNGFSVAGTTLSVDGANNRVGIGIAAPLTKFHIKGIDDLSSSNSFRVDNLSGAILLTLNNQGNLTAFTTPANQNGGIASWSTNSVLTGGFSQNASGVNAVHTGAGYNASVYYGSSVQNRSTGVLGAGHGAGILFALKYGAPFLNTRIKSYFVNIPTTTVSTLNTAFGFDTSVGGVIAERFTFYQDSFGIGITVPTARLQVRGSGTTNATFTAKFENASLAPVLYMRDDQRVGIGTGSIAADTRLTVAGAAQVAGWRSRGTNRINYGNNDIQLADSRPNIEWDSSVDNQVFITGIRDDNTWGIFCKGASDYGFQIDRVTRNIGLSIAQAANTKLLVRGSDATEANFAARFLDVSSNPLMVVRNDATVGIGTAAPSSYAALELSSTTKGFIPPRLTGVQATALEANVPPDSTIIYVSSTDGTFSSVGLWCKISGTWTQL